MIAPGPHYQVELDQYCGPLDLLVFLVKRSELSTGNLRLAEIVRQFVSYVEVLEFLALDEVGDFLVMITTLMEIKSREMLPRAVEEEKPVQAVVPDGPPSDLIRQLMLHKQFQQAGQLLRAQAAVWMDRYPRMESSRPSTRRTASMDYIKDVELWDLISALSRILKSRQLEKHEKIKYDETPLHIHIQQLGERVRQEKVVSFHSLFNEMTHRSQIVGLFLAILELLRHHGFRAVQEHDFADIVLYPPADDTVATSHGAESLSKSSLAIGRELSESNQWSTPD